MSELVVSCCMIIWVCNRGGLFGVTAVTNQKNPYESTLCPLPNGATTTNESDRMTTTELDVRRKVMSTPMGEVAELALHGMQHEQAKLSAIRFSRAKKMPIRVLESPENILKFQRCTAEESKAKAYPEMDMLKIGESHLYEVAYPKFQAVRMAASAINRRGEVLLSCAQEAGGIRVLRHPLAAQEVSEHGLIAKPPRSSKYGLEALETVRELSFTPADAAEVLRLRAAVSIKGRLMGWKLRCRLQDDGSMLVVRLENAA